MHDNFLGVVLFQLIYQPYIFCGCVPVQGVCVCVCVCESKVPCHHLTLWLLP